MPGENLVLDPYTENANNAALWIHARPQETGLYLSADGGHQYPPPEPDAIWVSSPETEGQLRANTRPGQRTITTQLQIIEPSNGPATNRLYNPLLMGTWTGSAGAEVPPQWTMYDNGGTGTHSWSKVTNGGPYGEHAWRLVSSNPTAAKGFSTAGSGINTIMMLGDAYVYSWWWKGNVNPTIAANTALSANNWILNPTASPTVWQQYALTVTTTTTFSASGGIDWFYVYPQALSCDVQFARAAWYLLPATGSETNYNFNGDTPGCYWTGTRHASASIRRAAGGLGTSAVTNLITNPSAGVDLTSWSTTTGITNAGATQSRVTGDGVAGSHAVEVVCNGAATYEGSAVSTTQTFLPSKTYRASIWARSVSGTTALQLVVDGAGGADGAAQSFTATTSWQRVEVNWTPTAVRSSAVVGVRVPATSAATFRIDAAMLIEGSTSVRYFDGTMPPATWTGTAHASTSVYPAIPGSLYAGIRDDLENKIAKLDAYGGTYQRILPSGESITFDVQAARIVSWQEDAIAELRRVIKVDIELLCSPYGRGAEVTV